MKIKNILKTMPLCVLACLTSCNNAMTTTEIKFIDEKVKVTLSQEKIGYVKKVKRILNELEQYADPSNVTRLLNKYRDNSEEANRKIFTISDDYMLFELIYSTCFAESSSYDGFFSYDNGYKAMIKKIINEGLSPYDIDDDERNKLNQLAEELRNCYFITPDARNGSDKWYGEVQYSSNDDFTFDFRPVIEGYALDVIDSYLTQPGKCEEYSIEMSPNNMHIRNSSAKDYTFESPYGKPITIKGIYEAYISVASAVDNKVVFGDEAFSTKYIDLSGAKIEHDAAIVVTEPRGAYAMRGGVKSAKYAFDRMKASNYNFSYDEQYGVYTILFKNEEIVYCSKGLDVKYGGASYGMNHV